MAKSEKTKEEARLTLATLAPIRARGHRGFKGAYLTRGYALCQAL